MKIAKMHIAVTFLLVLTTVAMARQNGAGQPKTGAPKLVIDSLTHDFGDVKPGTSLIHSFRIKNEGTADLLIQGVHPG